MLHLQNSSNRSHRIVKRRLGAHTDIYTHTSFRIFKETFFTQKDEERAKAQLIGESHLNSTTNTNHACHPDQQQHQNLRYQNIEMLLVLQTMQLPRETNITYR